MVCHIESTTKRGEEPVHKVTFHSCLLPIKVGVSIYLSIHLHDGLFPKEKLRVKICDNLQLLVENIHNLQLDCSP